MDLVALQQYVRQIDVSKIMAEVLELQAEYIKELNTRAQLFDKGIGADGQKLKPPYATSTLKRKRSKGLPQHVTLFDTGAFHKSWEVEPQATGVNIFSEHFTEGGFPLFDYLDERYGGKVFGLTEDNRDILVERIKPLFIEHFKDEVRGSL